MEYTVQLQQLESRPLAVVRRRALVAELPRVVPEACGTVWNALRAQAIPGAGRNVAVYLDDQINLEVGVELDGPFVGTDELVSSSTPGGIVATTTHFGPYHLLPLAHQAIRLWCKNHGHTPAGINWEVYGHWQKEWKNNPSAITTEVHYLLKR